MTNNLGYTGGMMMDQPNLDTTLIKIFLNTVKEGDLQQIINEIEKYSFDVRYIKDSQYDQNALFYAALIKDDNNALKVMKYFIEELGVDPRTKDKIQQTPVYYAAREGRYNVCEYLISKGVPLNDPDLYHQTPVYYASREGRLNIVQLFANHGADVDLEDKYGQTCLFYAIREGHTDVVDFLAGLPQFTKIDKSDKKGLTPYLFALKHGKTSIAELLVNKGASTQTKAADKKSKTKKTKVEEEKVEDDVQKPKRYVLCRFNENGEKVALTLDEIEEFEKNYPEVSKMMRNPELLAQIEENCPEELKNHDSWEKSAKKLMNSLWKFKDSEIFHKPVNPMELGIPDYFDIIKNPMDFSTIKRKLNNYSYTNCREFTKDMDLVYDNCILYNGERSVIGAICNNVRNEYKKLFEQLNMSIFL